MSDLIHQVGNISSMQATPPALRSPHSYTTYLNPAEEATFQQWVKSNKIPWQDSPNADYDMRGFWKAMMSGDPVAVRSAANGHFPDTWKTPYHKWFSNESMYATPDAPHWVGDRYLVDKSGRLLGDSRTQEK